MKHVHLPSDSLFIISYTLRDVVVVLYLNCGRIKPSRIYVVAFSGVVWNELMLEAEALRAGKGEEICDFHWQYSMSGGR